MCTSSTKTDKIPEVNRKKRRQWLKVTECMFHMALLAPRPAQRALSFLLKHRHTDDFSVTMSQKDMAKKADMSLRSFKEGLAWLVDKKFIKTETKIVWINPMFCFKGNEELFEIRMKEYLKVGKK